MQTCRGICFSRRCIFKQNSHSLLELAIRYISNIKYIKRPMQDVFKVSASQYLLAIFPDVCNAAEETKESRKKRVARVSQKNRDADGISTSAYKRVRQRCYSFWCRLEKGEDTSTPVSYKNVLMRLAS